MIGTQDGFFLSFCAVCAAVYRSHCPFPVVLKAFAAERRLSGALYFSFEQQLFSSSMTIDQ